jgi:hypothetical protein
LTFQLAFTLLVCRDNITDYLVVEDEESLLVDEEERLLLEDEDLISKPEDKYAFFKSICAGVSPVFMAVVITIATSNHILVDLIIN